MPKPRTYQTEAVIIKKTKLGEADRILTLYTPEVGKLQAVAKGVRRPKSKLSGHLELLTHSMVSLAHGRNLDTVIGSQTINSFLPLKNDLRLSSYALYASELVYQFAADNQENRPLFQLLIGTLAELCQFGDSELLLRYFEVHLLHESGYRPQLQECIGCHQPLEPVTNFFSASAGGMLCPRCHLSQRFVRPLPINALKVLRILQDSAWSEVSQLKLSPEVSYELEWVLRNYLRYLLEREVKSVAWLDTLKRQTTDAIPADIVAQEGCSGGEITP